MDRAAALKDEGANFFKAKDFSRAYAKYAEALKAALELLHDSSPSSTPDVIAEQKDLCAVLYTNRALMAFKLHRLEDCERDCTLALEIGAGDARSVKALFRRAQARSRMDPPRLSLSLKDLSQLLSIDPSNRSAQRMLQKITEQVRAQPAPVVAALEKLKLGSSSDDDSKDTMATKPSENTKLLRWILSQTFDEIEAKDLMRKNIVERLWSQLRSTLAGTEADEARRLKAKAVLEHDDAAFAVRALASLRSHQSLDKRVSKHIDLETARNLVDMVPEELLSAAIFLLEGAVLFQDNIETKEKEGKINQGRRDAMATLIGRLRSEIEIKRSASFAKACTAIVQGVVKWCVPDKKSADAFTDMGGVKALVKAADPHDADLRGMVALGLGRVFSAYDDDETVQSRIKEDILPLLSVSRGALEQANGAAALLSVFMVNVSVGVWAVQLDASAACGSGATLGNLCRLAVQGAAIVQAMVVSIFSHMVNDEAGRAVVAQESVMAVLQLLMSCDTPAVRAGAAVAVAKAKAIESKYGFKADTPEGERLLDSVATMLSEKLPEKQRDEEISMRVKGIEALSYLMSSTVAKQACIRTRIIKNRKERTDAKKTTSSVVSALVTLAKDSELCATESNREASSKFTVNSGSNTGKHSCGYGLACIFRDLTMSKQKKSRDKLREMEVTEEQWEQFKKITKSGNDNPAEFDSEENVRMRVRHVVEAGGISALVSLANNPNETSGMREALSQALSNMAALPDVRGKMVTHGCLKPLIRLAGFGLDAKGNDIATMEKLRKERQNAEIRSARKKVKDEGGGEEEMAAAEAAAVASHQSGDKSIKDKDKGDVTEMLSGKDSVEARRAKAATVSANTKTRHLAGQALARILISTNPEMLPLSRVMDSIKPLLALIRTSGDNLMEYEALMATTNLLSMHSTESTRERFVSLRGIAAVEYCQFSQHPQVRCAATECFCNIVYHEEFIRYVAHDRGERLRLWISFSEDFQEEENYKNARAAMGGIAMMAEVPALAILLCERGAVEAMCWVIQNTDLDELHLRAVSALRAMCCLGANETAILPPREDSKDSAESSLEDLREAHTKDNKKPGDPKLAAAVLAGYTHTTHFDDVQSAEKEDLEKEVSYFAKQIEKCREELENAVQEKQTSAETLEKAIDKLDETIVDDDGVELGEVEIEVLEDGIENSTTPGSSSENMIKKEKTENDLSSAVEDARKRYEKAVANEDKCKRQLEEAKGNHKEAGRAVAEYSPDVWTGGLALLSALAKLSKNDSVKAQCLECMRSVSDKLKDSS